MQSGNVKLLRTIRIVRVFKIFSKFQNLHRIFQALAYAAYPVSSALFISLVISAIYSIFGTHWFRDRSPEFADFRQSMYTLFIIFTGDFGWNCVVQRCTCCERRPFCLLMTSWSGARASPTYTSVTAVVPVLQGIPSSSKSI
jgi:hypothetical protein